MTMQAPNRPALAGPGYVCGCCEMGFSGALRFGHTGRACDTCRAHLQAGSMEKDKIHIRMWSARAAELEQRADIYRERMGELTARMEARIKALATETADLRDAVRDGVQKLPAETIAAYLETDAVFEAHAQRDSAYRQRDAAMRAIWRIDDEHHRVVENREKCVCGAGRCEVERAVHPMVEGLRRWEQRQIERTRQGKQDALPDEHPAVRRSTRLYRDSTDDR